MVSLDASGLVPADKHNLNSIVFLYVSTSGLVPAQNIIYTQWFPYLLVAVAWYLLTNII